MHTQYTPTLKTFRSKEKLPRHRTASLMSLYARSGTLNRRRTASPWRKHQIIPTLSPSVIGVRVGYDLKWGYR
eukprot:71421-Amorphochlora_amoeboformis.AAC.1